MKKYKICVYAICKNEEKFVNKWVDSANEADAIYVLDTGSTDNTVSLLKERNVNIEIKKYNKFRFDEARNAAMDFIPEDFDICICLDFDEVLDKGWRKKLEKQWNDSNCGMINCNWSFDNYGNPAVTYYMKRIHARKNYRWKYAIHEIVSYTGDGEEKKITINGFNINHYPDKNKNRKQYLELLETAQKENPTDDRLLHYLGREYMYNNMYNKAIDTLIKHVYSPTLTYKDEKCTSMRFIGKCYRGLKREDEAAMWFAKAIMECPNARESYVEFAYLEYSRKNWESLELILKEVLKIKDRNPNYINEGFCWDSTIPDLLSIALYNLGKYEEALEYVNMALDINPDDKRLLKNKEFIVMKLS